MREDGNSVTTPVTLGIVDQIRELNEQTTIVLEDLKPFLRGTYMLREAALENDK